MPATLSIQDRIRSLESADHAAAVARRVTPADQQYTYRALFYNTGRMPLMPITRSDDFEFIGARRQLAHNIAFTLDQNLPLIGWAARTHLNYVSLFEFQPDTNDDTLNDELAEWYHDRNDEERLDVQGRLGGDEMLSVYAGLKVYCGYSAILKVDGGRCQLFEAWQMARGAGCEADEKKFGVKIDNQGLVLDKFGKIVMVALCNGESSGALKHIRLVPRNEILIGGFTNRASTALYASPLLPAMELAQDYLDVQQYQVLQAKVASQFGFYWLRDHTKNGPANFDRFNALGYGGENGGPAHVENGQPQEAWQPTPLTGISPGMMLEGQQGDKVGFITADIPSPQWDLQGQRVVRMILASMDIPDCFWDTGKANYSSMRVSAGLYKQSCFRERRKNARIRRGMNTHLFRWGVADGTLPISSKFTPENLPYKLVPRGVYLLDTAKELSGVLAAIGAGLTDFETAAADLGYDNQRDTVRRLEKQYLAFKNAGITPNLGHISVRLSNRSESDEEIPEIEGTAPASKPAKAPPANIEEAE